MQSKNLISYHEVYAIHYSQNIWSAACTSVDHLRSFLNSSSEMARSADRMTAAMAHITFHRYVGWWINGLRLRRNG